jgi:membrane protease YdiL (CAAX protease family)
VVWDRRHRNPRAVYCNMAAITEEKAAPQPRLPGHPLAGHGDYWSQSQRPLAGLFFAGPLLLIYEAGVILLGPSAPRNGIDTLLREQLKVLGFRPQVDYFLLPALTVGILLGLHYISRQPWQVSRKVLVGMGGESLVLAVALWLSWGLYRFFMYAIPQSMGLDVAARNVVNWLGTLNSYFGAGIYEELFFRMILLNLVVVMLAWLRAGRRASLISGVVLSSVLFSAAHYVGPYGDKLEWLTFCFRFLAGAFFALLYLYRGFGIAAGTHALYDVLAHLSAP